MAGTDDLLVVQNRGYETGVKGQTGVGLVVTVVDAGGSNGGFRSTMYWGGGRSDPGTSGSVGYRGGRGVDTGREWTGVRDTGARTGEDPIIPERRPVTGQWTVTLRRDEDAGEPQ